MNLTAAATCARWGIPTMTCSIIGICNLDELTPATRISHAGGAVKRGIWAAGGSARVPTISMCEVFHDISTLIYRNLMAMDTESSSTRYPLTG